MSKVEKMSVLLEGLYVYIEKNSELNELWALIHAPIRKYLQLAIYRFVLFFFYESVLITLYVSFD